jgi:hypothetical protein
MAWRGISCSAALVVVAFAAAAPVAAQVPAQDRNCAREAASIQRAETQLPKLEVAPPNDRQIVCITLETNLLFAQRLAVHLKHCPRSPLARDGGKWEQVDSDYSSRFRDRNCKPAIRPFRG